MLDACVKSPVVCDYGAQELGPLFQLQMPDFVFPHFFSDATAFIINFQRGQLCLNYSVAAA